MRKSKRLLSLFLAFTIVLSAISVGLTAFADELSEKRATYSSSEDDIASIAYDGLSDSYNVLAEALKKEYVTSASYDKQDRVVTVTDNDDNDILNASIAFYDIVNSMGSFSRGTTNYTVAVNIANTLKSSMGSDWTSAMEEVVTKVLSGCGSASNGNKAKDNVLIITKTASSSLASYNAVSEIPEEIANGVQFSYTVTSSRSGFSTYYTLNSLNKNESYSTSSDIPKAVKAYYDMFCTGVISTAYADLDDKTYTSLSQDGKSTVNAISSLNLNDETIERLFGDNTLSVANAYLDGLVKYALREFTESVEQLGTLTNGKSEKDFTSDELEEISELIETAKTLYGGYTDEQKKAVADEYALLDDYYEIYVNANNYNVTLEYAKAIESIEKYTDDDYVIERDELDELKELLESIQDIKDEFIGDVDSSDVKNLDKKYNLAEEKYNEAVVKFQWEDYYNVIDKLADKFDSSAVTSINSTNVVDNTDGDVLETAQLTFDAVSLLIGIDSSKYSSTNAVADQIKSDLKTVLGTKGYDSKNVDTVITQLCSATFIVTPDYMSEYNSVSEIPEEISYEITTFSYATSDGKLVASKSNDTYTDTVAYVAFNGYKNVFTDDVLNGNLSNLSVEELSQLATDAQSALDAVSVYSDETVTRLLGDATSDAQAVIDNCNTQIVTIYCDLVDELYDDFGNRTFTADDIEAFAERCEEIEAVYDLIPTSSIDSEAVVTAKQIYDSICEQMEVFEKNYYYNNFVEVAQKNLDKYYTTDENNDAQIIALNPFDITYVKTAIKNVQNAQALLSSEDETKDEVVFYNNVIALLQKALNELTNNPSFSKYDVEYPDDVTVEQVTDVIDRLDDLLGGELVENLLGNSLQGLVNGTLEDLLTGESANALMQTIIMAVYPMLQDGLRGTSVLNSNALSLIRSGMLSGLYPDPEDFQDRDLIKTNYYSIGKELAKAGTDWNAVNWDNIDWEIETIDDFCTALGSALAGAAQIVKALLANQTASVKVIGIGLGSTTKICDGNAGYRDDILPLLELLGCENLTDPYTFENNYDLPDMFKAIIDPLVNRVDELLEDDTISSILELLPNFAYLITYDKLTDGINDLLSPLSSFGLTLESLLGTTNLDGDYIMDTLNGLVESAGIVLPDINWAELAGIGEWQTLSSLRASTSSGISGSRNYIKGNKEDVLVYLTYYIADVIAQNGDTISSLVGDSDIALKLISQVATKCADDKKIFTSALFTLLTPYITEDSTFNLTWNKTTVKYPSTYNASDIEKLVNILSSILNTAIPMLLDGSLNDLIEENLYTGDLINTLFSTIYGLLDDSTVDTVLQLITITNSDGTVSTIDVSKDAIVKNLKKFGFKNVASIINKLDDENGIADAVIPASAWKINSSNDFINAISAILEPFSDIFAVLLAGKNMTINIAGGAFVINGANGYNNAIKPLLDALCCDSMSASAYNKAVQADSSNAISNILKPLLNLVSTVADGPINTVIDILPNVALFIDNGGLQNTVEQLLSPLNNIFSAITKFVDTDDIYSWLVSDVLGELTGFSLDWDNLQDEIIPLLNENVLNDLTIGELSVSLTIPNIDWGKLAGCSKKTSSGVYAVVSDTTVTVLRYVWSVLQTNKNTLLDCINELAGDGTLDTILPYVNKILSMSADDVITILVKLIKGLDSSSHTADWSFLYKNYKQTSVTYPSGVTSSDVSQVIDILSTAINNLLSDVLNVSLTGLVADKVYNDEIITKLAKTIYELFDDSTVVTVLGVLGADVSKDAVAKSLKSDYSAVAKSISSAKSFSTVDTSKWKWNVTDRQSFAKALTAVLRPLEDVLAVFLNSGTINIAGVVDFTGANGYANAVKPMLDALGCTTVSASKYASDVKKNKDNLLLDIINPVLNLVDEVLADPLNNALDILPSIANFINKGGVQKAVEELLYPITNLLDPLLSIVLDSNDSIFDIVLDLIGIDANWNNLQYKVISILNKEVLNDLTISGKKLSLKLPNISWSTIAGCGKVSGNSIKADASKELIVILRYVFDALSSNKSTLMSLVGGANSTVGKIVNNVLSCGADGLTRIVVNILLKLETVENVEWTFKTIKKVVTAYTENYGEEEYAQALSMTDDYIMQLLSDLAGISLSSLLTDNLYTNSIVNTLTKAIYQNLEKLDIGIDLNTVLGLVDVDITPSGVASQISDYKSASKTISKYSKWADVNFDNIDWGVTTGDRTSFVNALAAVLRPLAPVLRAVLSGDELVILGSIEIKGGNGYNTALVPIAEALGIDTDDLVSISKYVSTSNSDALITSILNPLLNKVEEIANAPVATLCDMLPNLAYFVYNGGIKDAVENLIAPVTNILEEIDPIYSVNIDLSSLDDIDIDGLVNSLIADLEVNGTKLGIQITDIDVETLAGRGDLVSYTSVRTYNSKQMVCKRVNADAPAVYISVIRYLLENIKANLDAINNLLASLNLSDSVMDIINQVLTMLATEDVDSVIEMLMELLFGFSTGDVATENPEDEHFDPFNLGDYYWVYWVVFAIVTVAVLFFLFLILKKKKEKEEEQEIETASTDV